MESWKSLHRIASFVITAILIKMYVYVSNSRLVEIIAEDPGYFNMLAKIKKHDIIVMVRKIRKKLSC